MPDFSLEDAALKRGFRCITGVDEAGRGPWAGPVVAGAAVIDRATLPVELAAELDDSKKLKPAARERLFDALRPHSCIGIGIAEAAEIDEVNILQATFRAMERAVLDLTAETKSANGLSTDPSPSLSRDLTLGLCPDLCLVDGNRPPPLAALPGCAVECVIKGDGLSLSIAAASIAAKVTRDRLMADLALRHPGYGWERNAGYGTAEHQAALARLGVTPEHRRSYKPILNILRAEDS